MDANKKVPASAPLAGNFIGARRPQKMRIDTNAGIAGLLEGIHRADKRWIYSFLIQSDFTVKMPVDMFHKFLSCEENTALNSTDGNLHEVRYFLVFVALVK